MESFNRYLKGRGKKDSVIDRNIRTVEEFLESLNSDSQVSQEDIRVYVESIEKAGKSAKGFLYAMMNYFKYLGDEEMYSCVAGLREKRTGKTRRKFQIKDFLNIDEEVIRKLNSIGINDVYQMLNHGDTGEKRKRLAEKLKVPEEVILELVNLSDLTRLGYVKRKLSRLYYDSGFRSPLEVSGYQTEALYEHFKSYVEESGWDGMVPNPKDLENNINQAKKLKKIVDY